MSACYNWSQCARVAPDATAKTADCCADVTVTHSVLAVTGRHDLSLYIAVDDSDGNLLTEATSGSVMKSSRSPSCCNQSRGVGGRLKRGAVSLTMESAPNHRHGKRGLPVAMRSCLCQTPMEFASAWSRSAMCGPAGRAFYVLDCRCHSRMPIVFLAVVYYQYVNAV